MRPHVLALALVAGCGGRTFRPPPTLDEGRPARSVRVAVGEARDEAFRRSPPAPLAIPARAHGAPVVAHLTNGVLVYMLERHDLPFVSLSIVVEPGPSAPLAGVAAVYSWARLGSAEEAAQRAWRNLRFLGATVTSGVSAGAVYVTTTTLSPFWRGALSRVAPMVVSPALKDDDVERARAIALEGAAFEGGARVAKRTLMADLFPGPDPRGVGTYGATRAQIGAVTAEAVEAFHRSHLDASHVGVAVVGDFVPAHVTRALEHELAKLPRRAPAATAPRAPAARRRHLILIDRPGAVQSDVVLGWPGPAPTDPDRVPLDVLAFRVGEMSSRLNLTVRKELGATYGVRMSVDPRPNGGVLSISASIDTSKTPEALSKLLAELDRLRVEPLAPAALAEAKATAVYRMDEGSTSVVARRLASALASGRSPRDLKAEAARIQALSADELRAAAAKWLSKDAARIVVVGDAARIAEPLRALGLDFDERT